LAGILAAAAFATNLWAAILLRGQTSFGLSAAAAVIVLATIAAFFGWTQKVNKATGYWSERPGNWRALRRRWEFSHAANAALTFAALCCACAAAVATTRGSPE
jgi:hypothetical protein